MADQEILCRYCNSSDVIYAGKNSAGNQRCKCKSCNRIFQLSYSYQACAPGVKAKIVEMAQNASGIRDTARVLGINKGTVISTLRKKKRGIESK